MSLRKLLSPVRLAGAGLFLLLVTAAVLWLLSSSDYLLLPERARLVAPLVSVHGGKDPTGPGGIYYDAVIIRRAKLFEQIFPWIHDGATLVPADQVNPPGVNDSQRRTEDLREMARSQDIAAAVALAYLGYDVKPRSTGALISDVIGGSPAAKAGLEPTEVIVAVDGAPVRKTTDLRRLIGVHKPGETVRLTLRSAAALLQARVKTVADPNDPQRAVIGVFVTQATQVKLPFPVRIDTGSIGGPSAGLAFALDVLEELGHNVDRGYKVAATGELQPDGSVVPIGGAKQKAIGVRRAKVDVFLVPTGDNARDARRYAGPVRVIAVESFRQALHALATLPPKR
jgi:PDZ domain-containing protein